MRNLRNEIGTVRRQWRELALTLGLTAIPTATLALTITPVLAFTLVIVLALAPTLALTFTRLPPTLSLTCAGSAT